jgi:hypothetical protein
MIWKQRKREVWHLFLMVGFRKGFHEFKFIFDHYIITIQIWSLNDQLPKALPNALCTNRKMCLKSRSNSSTPEICCTVKTASSTNKNTFVPDQLGNRSRIKMLHAVLNFSAIISILVGPLLVTNF